MRVSISERVSMCEPNTPEPSSLQKLCTFVLINLSLFVSYALYTLPGAFLPIYNMDRGIGAASTGIILACVPLCYIIVCPIAGKLLDKYSAKTMLLISTGMLAVVTFLSAALGNLTSNTCFICLIVLLRLIQGANGGVIDVIAFAITAKIYPNNIALTTSIIETSLNLAVAFSPFLGGVFFEVGGFYLSFVVTACAVSVVLIGTFFGVTNVDTKRDEDGGNLFSVLKEVTVWFPAWHSAACMILFNFYIPILSPYVQETFNAGPTFAGFALLINTAGICITAPVLGHLMDKLNPYVFMAASAFLLPVSYWFIGPAPFLAGVLTASKTQLLVALGVIGVLVPLGCYPGLLIMFDIYTVKFGKMPQAVKNYITSIYCASFPLGGCIGSAMSGIIAERLSFGLSTTYISFAFFLQTVLVIWWCIVVWRVKRQAKRGKLSFSESSPLIDNSEERNYSN